MNERIEQALKIVLQLQVANSVLSISVGSICVWCSESCSEEDFTFEACRAEFLKEIEAFIPFLAEERAGS